MSKILIVAGFRESILKFRGHLIAEFRKRGHQVHIACPGIESSSMADDDWFEKVGVMPHNVSLMRASISPLSDIRGFTQIYRLVRQIRPDICLCYTVKPNIFGTLAAWAARVPKRVVLITGLGYVFTNDRHGLLYWIIRRLYSISLKRATLIIFHNCDDRTKLYQEGILPLDAASTVVNGSGVDLDEYSFRANKEKQPSFLMIARLLGDKGVREYVRAASLIHSSNPGIRFKLIGWIDENPDCIKQHELDEWINSGHIEYLGRLNDVRSSIEESSVYVLPSHREGTPRTVLEAMAMGRPIITTDTPGCRETVIEGENGFLVPVNSVDALVEAMQRFIDNPKLAVEMGRRSREIAEEKYDVHKVNAVMLREIGVG